MLVRTWRHPIRGAYARREARRKELVFGVERAGARGRSALGQAMSVSPNSLRFVIVIF